MKYKFKICGIALLLMSCKSVKPQLLDGKINLGLHSDRENIFISVQNLTKETYKTIPLYFIYGSFVECFDKNMKKIDFQLYSPDFNRESYFTVVKSGEINSFTFNIHAYMGELNKGTYYLRWNDGKYFSNLLKVNFDPSKDPRWDTSKDGPMLEAIRIDTTNAEYVGFWIKNNNHKRKLKLKDLSIICDSIEDVHGLMTCDTKNICTYNASEMNDYLKKVFVIKVNRSFVEDLKVFDRIRFGGLAIFHNEDRDHLISINRTLSKFEYH